MALEDRIKKARNFAGLTQPQLAELIDVSLATIKNYEKDASAAKVGKVIEIATACNVDEGWLFTGRGAMSAEPHIAESEKIKRIVTEHQGVVKNFKDPERAKNINKRLLEIEELSEKIYDRVDTYIEAARDSARAEKSFKKTRKIRKGPRKLPASSPKKSANGN